MNYTQNVDIIDEIPNEQTNSKSIWQSESLRGSED